MSHNKGVLAFGGILFGLMLTVASSSAWAACANVAIDGWNAGWTRSQCVEDTAPVSKVPNNSVHRINNPPCDHSEDHVTATEVQTKFIDALGPSSMAAGGTALAGPVGGLVGAAAGKAAADGIEAVIRHNTAGGRSNCVALCVNVPPQAKNITMSGYVFPIDERKFYAVCDFSLQTRGNSFAGRCDDRRNGDWAAMTPPTSTFDARVGTTICSTAKNWTDAFDRTFTLRVGYDLP